ncbi:HET-domain-containing protein [Thozetella sp. PMI_491]|nr:HET-domain-containing protein [Thozetella sp. PMI_491]
MTLCASCQDLSLAEIFAATIARAPSSGIKGCVHSESYSAVQENASSCPLCALLVADAPAGEASSVQDSDCITLATYTRDQWPRAKAAQGTPGLVSGLEVKIGPKGQNSLNSLKHIPVWVEEDSPGILKQIFMSRPKAATPDTAIVKEWLSACLRGHPGCRIPAPMLNLAVNEDPVPMPARLLELDPPGSPGDIRLLETSGQSGTYAALSHCWGTARITTTTSENFERHKECISIDELTANFRDAVQVTRALGFQYLWIDSLCIIQDDPSDWDAQSGKMAEVYTHAALTIAAANSANSEEGFLKPRTVRKTATLPFYTSPGVSIGNVTVGERTAKEIYSDDFRKDVQEGPLSSRGWTLQERLLARRTIFFGREELHWECRSTRWSESTRMRPIQYVDISAGLAAFRGVPIFLPRGAVNKAQLLNDWYLVLQEFTKRSLTDSNDKLPALSGISTVIHRALGSEDYTTYRAGLWSHDAPRALLWRSFGPRPGGPSRLNGPSWSWISRDARIFPAREEKSTLTDITNVKWEVPISGTDPYGRIQGGTVSFVGYIQEVHRISLIDPPPRPSSAPYPLSNALLYDSRSQQVGAAVLDSPGDESVFSMKLYAVPIRHILNQSRVITNIEVLLLQDCGAGNYCRVGMAELMGSNSNDAFCAGAPFAAPFQAFFYGAPKTEISIV